MEKKETFRFGVMASEIFQINFAMQQRRQKRSV